MSSPAVTIAPDRSVVEAAASMTRNGIKRLPVVDRKEKLVGILTRSDLVRGFARSDEEIEHEIREDVLRRRFWIDDPSLDLRVQAGNVRLSGRIARRTDVELLPEVVARVPGVVSIHSTLRWRHDDRGKPLDDFETQFGQLRRT
jgi:CBS domain-containing protein